MNAPTPLLPAGWAVAVVVAVIAYVAKPEDELGFALVVGGIATVMAAWTFMRSGKAPAVVSLVLGTLWTLLFGGYAVANLTGDDRPTTLVFIGDALAVIGGLMIVVGAVMRLRRLRPSP